VDGDRGLGGSATRVVALVALTAAISGAALLAGQRVGGLHAGLSAHYHELPDTSLAERPIDTLSVRWASTDLVRAAQPGRICVSVAAHRQACTSYRAGQRPADALTAELRHLGLLVRSNG
jgi:hypothetical protein